ncbi:UNVERIFIED_CONTAM: hypothetical protein Scaly_0585500 [Sesamum calycinum]|uniref:Reverse transcriptase domain-containing protein n=1 Tax=Sesamum calycinum TaxID=2727403 RepID=A0AAW2RS27_9LAMI
MAFVLGKLITDNVLVAYEINHYLAHKYGGSVGHAVLKLDLSKAYDRVEWTFLERVLAKLGFHPHFISLVLTCVSTMSYSIMLSGQIFGYSHPERGLRQGDPLSPYLFLFYAKALSQLISTAEANEELRGVVVSRHGPRVSHLLFADDTLIFVRRPMRLCKVDFLANVLGVTVVERHAKYLALPASIPVFVMSCFQVPLPICHELESLMVDFLRHNTGVRKIHWLAWDKRYFLSFELSNAHAVAGCSFTWRSILATRNVIVARSRWHIGTGQLIHIWIDRWIPRPVFFRVITVPNTLSLHATLNDLMHVNGSWNEEAISEIFRLEDVDAILANPQDVGSQDRLRLYFETHGRYSVHSGYKLVCQGLGPGASVSCSSSTSFKLVSWSFIWKAMVPLKACLFTWRACRNLFPISYNLASRGAAVEGYCSCCGLELKDLFHTLLRCHFARLVWALSHISWEYVYYDHNNLEAWFRGLHRNLDKNSFGRALLICWYLWMPKSKGDEEEILNTLNKEELKV